MAEGLDKQATERAGSRIAVLAWGMCTLALALIFASLVLGTASVIGLDFPLVGVSGALVGRLVASRKPRNPVGWFFLAGACIGGLQSLAGAYAVYGLLVDPCSSRSTSAPSFSRSRCSSCLPARDPPWPWSPPP